VALYWGTTAVAREEARMSGVCRKEGLLAVVAVLLLAGCVASAPAGGPLWQEGAAGAVPAEIARLNDHLGQLASA
jgi:hypothetical protein